MAKQQTAPKPRFRLKPGEEWSQAWERWQSRVGFQRYTPGCCALCRFYTAGYEGEGDCDLPWQGCGIEIPDEEFGPQCVQRALFPTGEASTCVFFTANLKPAPGGR
jgi:hypothetical protein